MYNKEAVKRKIAKEGLIPTISLLTKGLKNPIDIFLSIKINIENFLI